MRKREEPGSREPFRHPRQEESKFVTCLKCGTIFKTFLTWDKLPIFRVCPSCREIIGTYDPLAFGWRTQ